MDKRLDNCLVGDITYAVHKHVHVVHKVRVIVVKMLVLHPRQLHLAFLLGVR